MFLTNSFNERKIAETLNVCHIKVNYMNYCNKKVS